LFNNTLPIPYTFQRESVEKLFSLIKINNGACIFDETGLGKTITSLITATTIANNITVICGKANKSVWEKITNLYKKQYPKLNFLITTANSLEKNFDFESDFVIVDEAHNYRNIKNITFINLFKFIQKNNAKVLLLTATPFNNNYSELKAMFSLINFSQKCIAFYGLGSLFNNIEKLEKELQIMDRFDMKYQSFKSIGEYVSKEHSLKHYVNKLNKFVSTFSIRNTRENIKLNYKNDIEKMGVFPLIEINNINEYSKGYNEKLWNKTNKTNKILKELPLVKQNIINYLSLKNNQNINDSFDFSSLFKTLLYKRMDSSIYSFIKTIQNSIDNLYEAIDSINFIENTIKIKSKEYNLKIISHDLISEMNKDIKGFKEILDIWKDFDEGEKFDTLFNIIKENKKGKTIVFTEFNDTLELLVTKAKEQNIKFLTYSSKTNEKELDKILEEFDANFDPEFQTNKVQVLFCSDILSEGQNLHRANEVIHFDSKWNPAKITQRNGRVDRIIVNNKEIQKIKIHRFGSNIIIDEIIKLEDKIETKSGKSEDFNNFINTDIKYERFNKFVKNETLGFIAKNAKPKIVHIIRNEEYDFAVITGNIIFNEDFNATTDIHFINDYRFSGKLVAGSSIEDFHFNYGNNYISLLRNELYNKYKYKKNENGFHYISNPLYSNIFSQLITNKSVDEFWNAIDFIYNVLINKNESIDKCILMLSETGIIYESQVLVK